MIFNISKKILLVTTLFSFLSISNTFSQSDGPQNPLEELNSQIDEVKRNTFLDITPKPIAFANETVPAGAVVGLTFLNLALKSFNPLASMGVMIGGAVGGYLLEKDYTKRNTTNNTNVIHDICSELKELHKDADIQNFVMATNTDEAEKSFSTLGNMSSSQEDRLEALNQTLKTVLLTAKQTDIEKFQKHRLTLLRLRKILKKEGNKDIKPLEEALFKILLAYQNSPKGQELYGKLLVSHHASQQQ